MDQIKILIFASWSISEFFLLRSTDFPLQLPIFTILLMVAEMLRGIYAKSMDDTVSEWLTLSCLLEGLFAHGDDITMMASRHRSPAGKRREVVIFK